MRHGRVVPRTEACSAEQRWAASIGLILIAATWIALACVPTARILPAAGFSSSLGSTTAG
uniref:Uncharacterized protein n=1 Tax=Leersia perrieri TaxID=77586 RepID=A0A0D9XUQ6_9ORYZ